MKIQIASITNLFTAGLTPMPVATRKIPTRIVIYPKDVENITGRSSRTARSIIDRIRKALGKSKQQFVTVKEFCFFYGLEEDYVKDFL
ncbi:MAG: hypothetical protein JNN00_06660 [Chitinophagaceae bacterium]|nr:hypothetical protein [Chitinophagaceae bacterium]